MSERAPAPDGLALIEALVNTLLDVGTGADSLDTPQVRARFGLTEEDLPAARELRESLRATLLARAGHPPHRAVTPLGELLAAAPLVVTVDPADGSAALAPARGGSLLARVAAAVAEALVAGTWSRFKACEAPDCHWAYYDRSPAGRGRWCSMQVCGARAKMRRYRAKESQTTPASPAAGPRRAAECGRRRFGRLSLGRTGVPRAAVRRWGGPSPGTSSRPCATASGPGRCARRGSPGAAASPSPSGSSSRNSRHSVRCRTTSAPRTASSAESAYPRVGKAAGRCPCPSGRRR
ncbi:hypothetical protein STENM223S_01344 [Streptomyces tendae]